MAPRASKRKATPSQPEVVRPSSDIAQHDIEVPTPASAGKRKSSQDEDSSPKRQKLPVRVKSGGSARHRSLSVEIPFPQASQRDKSDEVQDSQDDESDAGDETEVFKTPMTGKHVKFDSDDYDEFVTPLERPAPKSGAQSTELEDVAEDSEEDEDEEDSDDDAPEAVSTHQSAAQSAKAAQAAAKAAEQQAAIQKRKRRERDALLKDQAESRKRALAEAQGPSRDSDEPESADATTQPPLDGQRRKKLEIPDVLPPEFLVSDDEDDEDEAHDISEVVRNKRIKFSTVERRVAREDRAPRDERVGDTVYRVVKGKTDKKLAPKMRKETRNLKDQLLSRNRAPQKRRGFLVKA